MLYNNYQSFLFLVLGKKIFKRFIYRPTIRFDAHSIQPHICYVSSRVHAAFPLTFSGV